MPHSVSQGLALEMLSSNSCLEEVQPFLVLTQAGPRQSLVTSQLCVPIRS